MRFSLARRYGFLLAALTALVGCCVLLVNLYYLDRYSAESLHSGQEQLSNVIEKQMIRDAELMASTLANNLDLAVYHLDFSAIQEQLETLNAESHILYTFIHSPAGSILHDGTIKVANFGQPIERFLPPDIASVDHFQTLRKNQFIHVAAPITVGAAHVGTLRIGVAYDQAEKDIHELSAALESQALNLRNNIVVTSLTVIAVLLASATVIIFLFSQRLLDPIRQLVERCRQYTNGEQQTSFRLDRDDEFGLLGDALETMKVSIKETQEQVEQLAFLDPLTHLPNRRMFNEELEGLLHWANQHNQRIAILFIDLDHFKQVNDVGGHDIGDQLLQQTANRLSALLSSIAEVVNMPVPEKLLLSRLGGDEFVMTIPAYKQDDVLTRTAEQIDQVLERPFVIEGHRYNISASIGITQFPEHADNITELLKQADIAMYAAKHSGRKRYRFYEPRMNAEVLERIQIIEGVREALKSEQLYVVYQPILDLKKESIVGAEALVRWQHPSKGNIPPANFIPLIEKTEFIVPLTLWVLEQACKDLVAHFLPRDRQFKLSVNVSGTAIEDNHIRDSIAGIIHKYELPPHRLHLEITETSMIENIERSREILKVWKRSGADIWIDDFGTGYSSLSYLHTLPIDGLKIDRSFVNSSDSPHQVIESIVALANSLELETISEGIETTQQHHYLTSLGCDLGQGFLFSRPKRFAEFIDLLDQDATHGLPDTTPNYL